MKEQVWLCRKPKRHKWSFGLCRLKNGMIVVGECYSHPSGFGIAGSRENCFGIKSKKHLQHLRYIGAIERRPERLFPGQRRMIVESLYVACCEELGIEAVDLEGRVSE